MTVCCTGTYFVFGEMERKELHSKWINMLPINCRVLLSTYVYSPHMHTSVKLNVLLTTYM